MDYRYIYLYAKKSGLVKIGITNKPSRRAKENGCQNATLIGLRRVFYAHHHEQRLHKIYAAYRVRHGTASGCTEWFKLRWWQVFMLRIRLQFLFFRQIVVVLTCFLLFLLVFWSFLQNN